MENKEFLTIDTGAGIVSPEQKKLLPLPLYDEHHRMLRQSIPEYDGTLPNDNLTVLINRLKITMKQFNEKSIYFLCTVALRLKKCLLGQTESDSAVISG